MLRTECSLLGVWSQQMMIQHGCTHSECCIVTLILTLTDMQEHFSWTRNEWSTACLFLMTVNIERQELLRIIYYIICSRKHCEKSEQDSALQFTWSQTLNGWRFHCSSAMMAIEFFFSMVTPCKLLASPCVCNSRTSQAAHYRRGEPHVHWGYWSYSEM